MFKVFFSTLKQNHTSPAQEAEQNSQPDDAHSLHQPQGILVPGALNGLFGIEGPARMMAMSDR